MQPLRPLARLASVCALDSGACHMQRAFTVHVLAQGSEDMICTALSRLGNVIPSLVTASYEVQTWTGADMLS